MIRKLFVLGLMIGAIAAPTALAKPVSSDVANGGYDPWAVGLIYQSTHAQPVNPGPVDPWAYSLVHPSPPTRVVATSSSSGFDYGDAGIGAGVTLGVAAILLASIGLGIRQRRNQRSGLATS